MEILGPVDPVLQEFDPATEGWADVKTGTQAAMERHGKKLKAEHPDRQYRVNTISNWITWHSEYDVRAEAVLKGAWQPK